MYQRAASRVRGDHKKKELTMKTQTFCTGRHFVLYQPDTHPTWLFYPRCRLGARKEIQIKTIDPRSWRPGVEPLVAYYNQRANGGLEDHPEREIPFDGSWGWTTPDATHSTLTYHEGPEDHRWMEEMDQRYILRKRSALLQQRRAA